LIAGECSNQKAVLQKAGSSWFSATVCKTEDFFLHSCPWQ